MSAAMHSLSTIYYFAVGDEATNAFRFRQAERSAWYYSLVTALRDLVDRSHADLCTNSRIASVWGGGGGGVVSRPRQVGFRQCVAMCGSVLGSCGRGSVTNTHRHLPPAIHRSHGTTHRARTFP